MDGWGDQARTNPATLIGASASALGDLLDEIAGAFDRRPPLPFVEIPSDRPLIAIGDSHGDWPAVASALEFARRPGFGARFVGLGDYVDRATRSTPDPTTLPGGSVWNAAYLLAWTAYDPERVILLRGNHEATRQIPVPAPTLLRELRRLYARSDALELWERLVGLLERLPLAARTAQGVFLTHGGIPPRGQWDPTRWDPQDVRLLEGLLWSDPELEYEDRSVGFPYGRSDLVEFLDSVGCRVLLKGHAANHSGRAIYGGRVLTVHTSDLFARWGEGGVLLAEVPAHFPVRTAHDLALRVWDGRDWSIRPIRFVPDAAPRAERDVPLVHPGTAARTALGE